MSRFLFLTSSSSSWYSGLIFFSSEYLTPIMYLLFRLFPVWWNWIEMLMVFPNAKAWHYNSADWYWLGEFFFLGNTRCFSPTFRYQSQNFRCNLNGHWNFLIPSKERKISEKTLIFQRLQIRHYRKHQSWNLSVICRCKESLNSYSTSLNIVSVLCIPSSIKFFRSLTKTLIQNFYRTSFTT